VHDAVGLVLYTLYWTSMVMTLLMIVTILYFCPWDQLTMQQL
jgi:hypothetical protein